MNQTRLSPPISLTLYRPSSSVEVVNAVHTSRPSLLSHHRHHRRRALIALLFGSSTSSSPRVVPTACEPLSARCSWVSISHSIPLLYSTRCSSPYNISYVVFRWYTVPRTVFPYHLLGGLFYFEEKQCYYVKLQRIPQQAITPDLLTLFFR